MKEKISKHFSCLNVVMKKIFKSMLILFWPRFLRGRLLVFIVTLSIFLLLIGQKARNSVVIGLFDCSITGV